MGGKKGVMNIDSFMEQPQLSKGLNIVFVWEERESMSDDEVLVRVREKANYLLTNTGYVQSLFRSLEEIGCYLWQQSLIIEPVVEEEEPSSKRRKTACELGSKMLSCLQTQYR
jgi:hypothetical protein